MWRFWIDTGGTFTDCIAIDPTGDIHRAKVLSNASLRGIVLNQQDHQQIQISAPWLNIYDDQPRECARFLPKYFFNGATLSILQEEAGGTAHSQDTISDEIIEFDSASSTITLAGPTDQFQEVPNILTAGSSFEINFREEAPTLAVRLIVGASPDQALPPMEMRLATTRGTNALLERRGGPCVLFITQGFGDLLQIGNQQRPNLFTLDINKPQGLTTHIIEIKERMAADGTILQSLDTSNLSEQLARMNIDPQNHAAAIAFLNSHENPEHENQLADLLRASGFTMISCSHELAPFIGYLPRAETAVVDAYLTAVVHNYLQEVRRALSNESRLLMMTSAGGLQSADTFRAKDGLLSGPAGGVAGAVGAAKASSNWLSNKGVDDDDVNNSNKVRVISFDMGGTSTDVARYDGGYSYQFEHEVGGAHLLAPALAIHTVAAGGGSICWFDGHRLRVGPQSAGADPGPACYGRGGPLTLTDVNLLLGRLVAKRFGIPVDIKAARSALHQLKTKIRLSSHEDIPDNRLLHGCLDIADERMADAVRKISIRQGFDPADYTLVAFGGAGGQHACAVAERLGMGQILIPEDAGLLSAVGLGISAIERFASKQLLITIEHFRENDWQNTISQLISEARAAVTREGIAPENITVRRIILSTRFAGQDSHIDIDILSVNNNSSPISLEDAITKFKSQYDRIFGHLPHGRPVELVSLRVVAASSHNNLTRLLHKKRTTDIRHNTATNIITNPTDTPGYERSALPQSKPILGPALIVEDHGLTVVKHGWSTQLDQSGGLILKKILSTNSEPKYTITTSANSTAQAIERELFANRFTAIAVEMGEMLRRTALSTNVKERLDFSCALLDPQGELVVNAPHIPVHLGALGECVRRVREVIPMNPGDVVLSNHPAFGGSHLPDVTVITPVFIHDKCSPTELIGYVANRAHHAEIGGTRPGSMPPDATTLAEEGVVIPPTYLVHNNETQFENITSLLTQSPYPTRNVHENIEDLRAALAANRRGEKSLQTLVTNHGRSTILCAMRDLKSQAAHIMRQTLSNLHDGSYEAEEFLDDGSPIHVIITVIEGHAVFDFTGSSPVHPGNLNATPAVVRSAVTYVLRLLIDQQIPLNEGMMEPITIILPERSILNPLFNNDPKLSPAVVGGNVETSQRLVDTLIKALGLSACSQGTMNNILFGNDNFGYYETVAGGAGAGAGFHGASAVHTHMTNTRITDPEIIERRYPVRIGKFALRHGSGGSGKFHGGDGLIREYEFLQPVELSILSQHRTVQPYGFNGGEPGKCGTQYIIRNNNNQIIHLKSIDGCTLQPHDRLILQTPGGGGWGQS